MRGRAVVAAFDGSTMQQVDSEDQFEASIGTRPANSKQHRNASAGDRLCRTEAQHEPTRRRVMAPLQPAGTFDRLGTPAPASTVGRLSEGNSATG